MESVTNKHAKNPLSGAKRCPRSETEFEDLVTSPVVDTQEAQ